MFGWLRRRTEALPADAELALTADRVFVQGRRLVVAVGRVECDELRVGDMVVAVGPAPVCRARVVGLEQFQRALDSAGKGEEVGVLFYCRGSDVFPQNVRLFRPQDVTRPADETRP